jgi:hypothetical protein
MALVARPTDPAPSLATLTPPTNCRLSDPLVAGEVLDPAAPCYIHTDNKVYMSTATADNAAAKVDGWTLQSRQIGDPVTLYFDVNLYYGEGLIPGTRYFLSTTKGRIDTVAAGTVTQPIAKAVSPNKIRIYVRN